MAATWICEGCGRANGGDLCPGCAKVRPIKVVAAYGSEKNREILDGRSVFQDGNIGPIPTVILVLAMCGAVAFKPFWISLTVGLILISAFYAIRSKFANDLMVKLRIANRKH